MAQQSAAATQEAAFSIPAQPLPSAIKAFIGATGWQISYSSRLARGKTSAAIAGTMPPAQALRRLLAGTGIAAQIGAPGSAALVDANTVPVESVDGAINLDTINVQGVQSTSTMTAPPPYAGGQVATGSQLGLLGNRDVFNTPFNTTSYTSKAIEDKQARTIGDVLADDPSVRVVGSQPNGSEVFFIRGFSVSSANVAYGGLYGIYPYWKGSIASAERVEIVKGPGALLFGMAPGGAIGGSINIVPKRAGENPLTRVIASYMSGENLGGQVDIGRRFGNNNEFGVRFNGVYRDGDTFRDTAQRQGEAALGLDYRGDKARISVDLGYLDLRNRGTEGLLSSGTSVIPAAPDAHKQIFPDWTYYNSQTFYGLVRGEYDLTDNTTIYAAAGGRNYKDQYVLPYGFGMTANGNFTQGFAVANEYYNVGTGETGIRSKFQTGFVDHQFSANASTFQQTNGTISGLGPTYASNIYNPTVYTSPALPALGAIPKTSQTTLNSVAVADTLSVLNERIQFTAGVRYQDVKAQNFSATTGAVTSDYNATATTPAFGLVVKPWDKVSLYANYIEGLTQGGIAPSGTKNVGEVFAPFVSKQSEVGVKVDWGRIGTTVSAFDISQPSAFTDVASNTYVVNGRQRNRGIEINVFGEVTKEVRVLGGAMFLDAELEKTASGTYDGNTATNTPRTSLNLGFEWDTPFVRDLTLTARGIYTGAVYADQANTQTIPDWTRYDVGARYKITQPNGKPIVISANIINVLDTTYWSSATLYRGAPRTFMLSTSFDF